MAPLGIIIHDSFFLSVFYPVHPIHSTLLRKHTDHTMNMD